jgi:5-oxoprolinase (ATP-hydrolysing) subunit A
MSDMRSIDLNADLGEGGALDVAMIAQVSSANIACGGHAGNESTMREAVAACIAAGVAIGAHPGYEDPEHFGRRELAVPDREVAEMVKRQITRLAGVAAQAGAGIRHVKLHGALYHQAGRDASLAAAVTGTVAKLLPGCGFFTAPGGALAEAGHEAGLRVVVEGFADRRYAPDGRLVPRSEPDSVITDMDDAVAQAMEIAGMRRVRTGDGSFHPLPAETICVHGDSPRALEILEAVRQALLRAGFAISPPVPAR